MKNNKKVLLHEYKSHTDHNIPNILSYPGGGGVPTLARDLPWPGGVPTLEYSPILTWPGGGGVPTLACGYLLLGT